MQAVKVIRARTLKKFDESLYFFRKFGLLLKFFDKLTFYTYLHMTAIRKQEANLYSVECEVDLSIFVSGRVLIPTGINHSGA